MYDDSTLIWRGRPKAEHPNVSHWNSIRQQALSRDSGCRVCGSFRMLEVHHRTYVRFGNELLDDVTVMCIRCHEACTSEIRSRRYAARKHRVAPIKESGNVSLHSVSKDHGNIVSVATQRSVGRPAVLGNDSDQKTSRRSVSRQQRTSQKWPGWSSLVGCT